MTLSLQDFADVVTALRGPFDQSAAEKRRAMRMTVSAKITAHILEKGHATRAYSALGAIFRSPASDCWQGVNVEQGQEVLLTLVRPHGPPLRVVAKAMHCRALADGLLAVGMEFVQVLQETAPKPDKQPQQASSPALASR